MVGMLVSLIPKLLNELAGYLWPSEKVPWHRKSVDKRPSRTIFLDPRKGASFFLRVLASFCVPDFTLAEVGMGSECLSMLTAVG